MLKSDAKKHFGSLEAIAQSLGITRSAVSQWPERVPRGAAYELQYITGGKLRVKPSLYGKRRTRTIGETREKAAS